MGVKGDLFELLSQAPAGLRSLEGSLREWRHIERSRQGLDQLSDGGGSWIAVGGFGRGSPPPDTVDVLHHVWTVPPDRWRIESADRVDLSDGTRRWTGSTHQVMEMDEEAPDLKSTVLGRVMRTGPLLGALKFGDPEQDEVAGRRCWRLDAQAAPSNFLVRPRMLAMSLGGLDHTLWFDAETGIMLRHIGMVDGQPAFVTEFLEVITDQPIEPGRFQFSAPPDSIVRRATDGLIHMAERHGVDLTHVDRSDPKAIRRALHEGMNHPQPFAEPTKEAKRAKHIPVDSPPADETAARAAIVYAFEHSGETAQDATLVHVQHGHGLSDLLDQARRRVPGVAAGSVGTVVEDVMFLGPDHAVVWFSVVADGKRVRMASGIEGRALLVAGHWVVEHATFVDLIGRGGVTYPPRG